MGKRKYNLKGISTALRLHFDENSSPLLSFQDNSYWPVKDLELALRDAANVHNGKRNLFRLFKSEDPSSSLLNWLVFTARVFVDVDCCTASMLPIAFLNSERTVKGDLSWERNLCIIRCKPDRVSSS